MEEPLHYLSILDLSKLIKEKKETIIETIPGWAHNIKNTGKKDLIAILWANENYNKEKPDTIYYKL